MKTTPSNAQQNANRDYSLTTIIVANRDYSFVTIVASESNLAAIKQHVSMSMSSIFILFYVSQNKTLWFQVNEMVQWGISWLRSIFCKSNDNVCISIHTNIFFILRNACGPFDLSAYCVVPYAAKLRRFGRSRQSGSKENA